MGHRASRRECMRALDRDRAAPRVGCPCWPAVPGCLCRIRVSPPLDPGLGPKAAQPMPSTEPQDTRLMADAIRALAMDAVQQAISGHPGAPMGLAEAAVALWG